MTTKQQQFIEEVAGYVRKYAPQFNVLVHSPIIAQVIIESNWGTSNKVINNGKYMHNYLGLKWRDDGRCPIAIGWFTETGSEQDANTGHYQTSEMKWCKFRNLEECILGYFQWTNIARYSEAKGISDPKKYIQQMKEAGYATSINYVNTIMNKIKELDLTKYDNVEKEENSKMPLKVCIDAGHYGKYNKCPNNSKYYESEVMWKLHLLQKKYLEKLGIEVITTRQNSAKDLDLTTRGRTAKNCALFISNHTNAVGSAMNESVDYVAIYHLTDDINVMCDDISKEVAKKLAPVITEVMGTKQSPKILTRKSGNDRNSDGMLNDNYYGVLHGARTVNVAGLILEHSFHTNSKSVEWLLNDSNLDKLARAESECIASYLLGKKVTLGSITPNTNTSNVIYRVQAGAYSSKGNATKQLNIVKAKGFKDAIMIKSGGFFKIQIGAYSRKANAEAMLDRVRSVGINAFITTQGGTKVS